MPLPFTPKFRDLVRTYTSTSGTGAFAPGPAVQGFSSFAETLSTGDQFYYCAQSVDRPAEREVGRGTLLPNGSIGREAVGGELTEFGAGTKTLSLVAAAEWFNSVEQGGGGSVQADNSVATREELASEPAAAGRAIVLTEAGREGLFVFAGGDQSALVAADTRQALAVAPASARSGTSGAWLRKFDGELNLLWFIDHAGRVPGVTDDLPAFDAALKAIKQLGGGTLRIPRGPYYCSDTVNVHTTVRIIGDGSAANGQRPFGTFIRFAKNKNGFVFNYVNTHGDGLGTQGQSTSSSMEGVMLWGGNAEMDATGVVTYRAGDSPAGHGVRIRTLFVRMKDVAAMFFGGDGFNIVAYAGSGGEAEGNANSFHLEMCHAQWNGGNGFNVEGSDSNAGTFDTCSALSNAASGFREQSFLGNSYLQCHTRDNGYVDATGCNKPVGMCTYGGHPYYLVAGQEPAGATTVPGTNSSVWRRMPGYAPGATSLRTWAPGTTWIAAAPYLATNVNARNVFLGCYAEAAQAPVQADYPSLFLGGLLSEVQFSPTSTAGQLQAASNRLVGSAYSVADPAGSAKSSFLGWRPGGADARYWTGHFDGTNYWQLYEDGANTVAMSGPGDRVVFKMSSTGADAPLLFRPSALALGSPDGNTSDARIHATVDSLAELNGRTVHRGNIYYYRSPATGGRLGLVCTTGGVVGSGAVLSEFGSIGATSGAAVSTVATAAHLLSVPDAGSYLRFTSEAPVTVTVPPTGSAPFAIGTVIELEQAGAGAVTIEAGAGVTVNARGSDLTLAGQSAVAALKKVGADLWTLTGDL